MDSPARDGDAASSAEYRAAYSPTDPDEPTFSILHGVANLTGMDEIELTPFPTVVNPDALNELFTRDSAESSYRSSVELESTNLECQFDYEGCRVSVFPEAVHIRLIDA